MTTKTTIITIVSVLLYTYVLACFGLAGEKVQSVAFIGGLYFLKYGSIAFGYFMAIFLPIRITKALEKRKETLYQIVSNKKIQELAEKTKQTNNKIMEEYIKNEDRI